MMCSAWQLLLKFQRDFTDNRPGAHDGPHKGICVRRSVPLLVCVKRGAERRTRSSIRNRPRERRFRNFKSAYIHSRVSFLWFCFISISFICFTGNSSRTFVSNVTTHRYKVTSTFPVHIREGSDQRF